MSEHRKRVRTELNILNVAAIRFMAENREEVPALLALLAALGPEERYRLVVEVVIKGGGTARIADIATLWRTDCRLSPVDCYRGLRAWQTAVVILPLVTIREVVLEYITTMPHHIVQAQSL